MTMTLFQALSGLLKGRSLQVQCLPVAVHVVLAEVEYAFEFLLGSG